MLRFTVLAQVIRDPIARSARFAYAVVDNVTGHRQGLKSKLAEARQLAADLNRKELASVRPEG